jgi:hypothetical protein
MYDARFFRAVAERAVGGFSGVLATALAADGADLCSVRWKAAFGLAGGVALLSILTSLVKGQVGPEGPGITETTRGAARSDHPDTVDSDKGAGRIGDP